MDIFTFEDATLLNDGTGIVLKEIFASRQIVIRQVLLHTGGKLEKYTENTEQLFYITEGEGTMVIQAERKRIVRGMLIRCPAKAQRSVVNSSSKDLSFLVITPQ